MLAAYSVVPTTYLASPSAQCYTMVVAEIVVAAGIVIAAGIVVAAVVAGIVAAAGAQAR